MGKIAYYISDHGFGHASRSIAILEKLIDFKPDIELIICCDKPLSYVQSALEKNIQDLRPENLIYHSIKNDFGFLTDPSGVIDYNESGKNLGSWIDTWSDYIINEYLYLKKKDISLIISDIPPQPFILASKLDVISIGISNFSWLDLYPEDSFSNAGQLRKKLWDAYRKASVVFSLPFDFPMSVFPSKVKTSLIGRDRTRDYDELRKSLNIGLHQKVVYLGFGMSIKRFNLIGKIEETIKNQINDELVFLVNSNISVESPNVRVIPSDNDPNTQDYIAMSDIAVLKPGYSSVAEAIISKTPILLYDVVQSTESGLIKKELLRMGVAREIFDEDILSGRWIDLLTNSWEGVQENYAFLPERFERRSEGFIVTQILELLEEGLSD